ncbi:IQ domain-containing protein C isoform X2 [Labrus mixtus]|uniref:IQ domain-containing protein C isoform X2 n=1 Tax=Labrus mixtus TaxID=508554 RepID=UPI0029C041A5|nr:IQ domain-containing protein C isoform X2 [Labrus mixtus]
MDRSELEKILAFFQACARGYLVRREVRRAQEDFEDIVKEIDGGLVHLEWRESPVIPTPHFTDTDGPFLRLCEAASRPSNPGPNICDSLQRLSSSPVSEDGDHHVLLEKIEAEKDGSQTKGHASITKDSIPISTVRGNEEGQRQTIDRDKDGGVMENTGDSTTVWSSLELDTNYGDSQKGPQQYGSVQEVSSTPEALRLHRNNLTMELLWLQQAIGSRKKYLSLKSRLSIS